MLKYLPERLLPWYAEHHRILPWRENREPYRVWLSEIMLQQTRVEAVKGYYARFLQQLPTVAALAEASEETLLKLWEGLGYYSRVRNLQKAARQIMEKHGGRFPQTYDEVRALAGVGAYTAGAICSICFGQPTPAVDGNVLRVLSRLFARDWDITSQKVKQLAEQELQPAMPCACPGDCNQALMELGAMICVPNGAPDCAHCPLADLCEAQKTHRQLDFPVKKPKKARPIERRVVYIIWKDGRIAVRKRPKQGLLANLWEFPHVLEGEDAQQTFGIALTQQKPLRRAKHVFTHLEWHMTGVQAQTSDGGTFTWVTPQQLEQEIALPSAFRVYRTIALQA